MNYVEFQKAVRRQGIVDQVPLPVIEDELVQQDVQFAQSTLGQRVLGDCLKDVPDERRGVKRVPDGLYVFIDVDGVPAIYYQDRPTTISGVRAIIKEDKLKRAYIPRGVFALRIGDWSPYYQNLMRMVQIKIGGIL